MHGYSKTKKVLVRATHTMNLFGVNALYIENALLTKKTCKLKHYILYVIDCFGMRNAKFLFLLLILLLSTHRSFAQELCKGTILERGTNEPIIGASVVSQGAKTERTISDINGRFVLHVAPKTKITISYIGYKTLVAQSDTNAVYYISSDTRSLNEVVVTAQESRKLSTTSIIRKQAMEHLQPSSFSDILELLPGGRATNGTLGTPNTITLREVGLSNSDYNTSSLGTRFVIDGAPISTAGNMQRIEGALDRTSTMRNFTNAGVDMRSISTDDIQDVEIVRGIPSVKYGDLMSGLVRIKRVRGGNNIQARFKADLSSKLFYVAKAFENKERQQSLNLSIDYLTSQSDPRNVLENYNRLTLSARLNKTFNFIKNYKLNSSLNFDYGGSFDRDKVDEEINYGGVDKYRSKYNRYALNFNNELTSLNSKSIWQSSEFTASVSYERNTLERTRLVQLSTETPTALTNKDGESDATFIFPYTYTGSQTVDGKPFNVFLKANGTFAFPLKKLTNSLLLGVDFQVDKNYGRGQEFDPLFPLYPETYSRPRRYSQVPASNILSYYAQETLSFSLGKHKFDLEGGVRAQTMLNLSKAQRLHNRYYLDPRLNLGYTLPSFKLLGKESTLSFNFGVGQHTLFPTIDQLYPEKNYIDFVEFSFYHDQREYRRLRLQTYVVDRENHNLEASRNFKWELRGDLNIGGNRLTITYFEEDMTSGFRSMNIFAPYTYKRYSMEGIDRNTLVGAPNIDLLPYTMRSRLMSVDKWANGSRTFKRGIEYTLTTVRFPVFNTRLTINGAWFKTHYKNALSVQEKPVKIIDGRAIDVVGFYADDEGYIREMFNTNFTFDSSIPALKLGISLSAQCLWFTANQSITKEASPEQYMLSDGSVHPFTPADANDLVLSNLVRTISSVSFERQVTPFSMNINLKATKRLLDNKLMVALFVNKLWDAHPDYKRNNLVIRRFVTPYFGLEMSVKL